MPPRESQKGLRDAGSRTCGPGPGGAMLGMVDPVAASLARSSTGRSGPSAAVVAADGPPGLAPGPAVPGVAAGGLGADCEHAGVGYPHGHAVLGTLGHAGVSGAHAGPEAGLQALGALGAEEGSLGGVNPGEPEGIGSESRRRGRKCPSGYLGCWTGIEAPDRPVLGRDGGRCEGSEGVYLEPVVSTPPAGWF